MGKIFVVYGPSGVGKSSVVSAALANDTCARARQVVTCTTRKPRFGEIDGVHYHFISTDQFHDLIKADGLIEWSEAYGYYYGVRARDVEEVLEGDQVVVLLLDRSGVAAMKAKYPSAQAIFLEPPSIESLELRLRLRGTEKESDIVRRMDLARMELLEERCKPLADHYIVNDDFDVTVTAMEKLLCF